MKNVINFKLSFVNLKIFLLYFVILEPELFTQQKLLSLLFAGFQLLIFICFVFKINKLKIDHKYFFWIIICLYLLFIMLVNGNYKDIDKWARIMIIYADSMMVADYYISRGKCKNLIETVSNLGIVYFGINFILFSILPNGLNINGYNYYFLGIRTDFLRYFFVFLIFSCLNFLYLKNKVQLILLLVLSVITFLKFSIATAITSILLLFLFYIFRNTLTKFLSLKWIVISTSVLSIAFIGFNASNFFSWFIVNILNKDVSLTNRMFIWVEAIRCIFDSRLGFIFGHGIVNSGSFVHYGYYWPAHNQLLQWLFEYGVIGTVLIFVYFLYLDKMNQISSVNYVYYSILFVLLISGISSSPFSNPIGLCTLTLLPLLNDINKQLSN